MQTSRSPKSSSSDDDELLLDTVELGVKKKHFLDYDYPQMSSNGDSHIEAPVSNGKNNLTSNSSSINTASNQLESKRKIDRPCTSKMASDQQLSNNSNNVESVYSILSMFGGQNNSSDIASKFLELSKNREMCTVLRQSGCISLLVQIIHSDPSSDEMRQKQCLQTLHNIIHCNADDKAGRRETRVIKLIEQLFDYCDTLRGILKNGADEEVQHPIQAIGTLMKISFDEEHRHAMCSLGALQTISTLIQLDNEVHGPIPTDNLCVTMRRYAGMCLTNLTFGDGNNKALLCSNKSFMKALVDQINSTSDELVQVTASVIRNLSWRADPNTKQILNEIETVKILTLAAMNRTQENTLKAILSALWNLSNHCNKNKADISDISGAIEFLIDMLLYEAPSKTMAVVENAGGILRNISSHISMHENLRAILRQKNCFSILLQQLKSPSLTIVSNACGTLGNLSQNSIEDQKFLRENGAIPMLRSLIYSKHKMISTGSTIALRHLLACKIGNTPSGNLDSVAKMMDLKELPTLNARKQKALEQELNLNVENYKLDETSPSTKDDKIRDFEGSSKNQSEMKVQDIEDEDAPTNFSKFYSDQEESGERAEYQETNLDQITDYSSRYAENQYEEEPQVKGRNMISSEDTMKCYNTEGTPRVISKAGSLTDLRKDKLVKEVTKSEEVSKKGKFSENASGLQSPEKTTNYCVERTPGDFSRNDSLSDLEEASHSPRVPKIKSQPSTSKIPPPLLIKKEVSSEKESVAATPKSVTFGTLHDETPLMFSRTSSMGSIDSAEQGFDDKSSVVSDFSRLASGVMSPSELPDSPTQSIPQSPSRTQMRINQIAAPKNIPTIRAPAHEREIIGAEAAEDSVNTFNVENTPAVFSSRTSLSNLSFDDEPKISNDAISKDFQLMKHPSEDEDSKLAKKSTADEFGGDITAEQSDAEESADDANLLESCINMGINSINVKGKKEIKSAERNESTVASSASVISQETVRFNPHLLKENPIDMMRAGAPMLPPYLPVVDEMNKFIVEDSPCNFSLMSGLSAITIDSNSKVPQHGQEPLKPVDLVYKDEAGTSNNIHRQFNSTISKNDFDDSLSSLSIESEDDTNLLTRAIQAGVNKVKETSNPINIPTPKQRQDAANESISSVDSCGDKDDGTNSILEQCIQSGIAKVAKKDSSNKRHPMTSSPKKSMLPMFRPSSAGKKKCDDEDILKECIASGMKTTKHSTNLVQNMAQLSITDSKNAETTSVTVQEQHYSVQHAAATGVVDTPLNKDQRPNEKSHISKSRRGQIADESTGLEKEPSHQATWTTQSGSSFEWNLDDNVLERSNEYPANKLSMMLTCSEIEDDSIMDISNEFMIENEERNEAKIEDKHKNPDLMLKSVDRLTQELVSTAEYLRKNADINDKMSNSISNDTWNDENSFPSISMSAPMIGSTNDETTFVTDQIQPISEEVVDGNSPSDLNEKTPTNEEFKFKPIGSDDEKLKIDFKLGGEIHNATGVKSKIPFFSYGPTSLDTCSTLSNSTIVQAESKNHSKNYRMEGSCASLMDLENVRPPSSMDSISMCSYQDISIQHQHHQQSPMRASLHKKSLMTGLIAKRALGQQIFGGSVESVNSNIDSIRPPSVMDELLDSMISVDSIVSEIVDPTLGISNYETALSDMEDSLTLRSCQDISKDETLTPISSDFSSIESTPKKKRSMRSVTPKQKRQSEKERYKTYTIAVDMLLKEQQDMENIRSSSVLKNARQKRQEDRQRFETQVIEISPDRSPSPKSPEIQEGSPVRMDRRREDPERFKTFNIQSVDDDVSIYAMTANFEHLRNDNHPTSSGSSTRTIVDIRSKLNRIKNGYTNDDSLEFDQQTSETESQRDHNNFSNPQIDLDEPKTSPSKSPSKKTQEIEDTGKSLGLSEVAIECLETALGSSNAIQQQLLKIQELQMKLQKQNLVKSPKAATTSTTTTMMNEIDTKPKSSYISPYRMATAKNIKSVRVTKNPTTIIAKVVTRNSSVELKAANSSKSSVKSPSGVKNKFCVIPKVKKEENVLVKPSSSPPPPLIRQGTFVKDEPTNENVPVVDSATPIKAPQSKLKPPMRFNSVPAKSSPSSPKRTSNLPTSVVQQLKFRSNSNASMNTKETTNTPPMRSNTGINLNNPKKNVSSKIAGIWKSPLIKNQSGSNSSYQLNGSTANKKIGGIKERIKRSSTCEEIV